MARRGRWAVLVLAGAGVVLCLQARAAFAQASYDLGVQGAMADMAADAQGTLHLLWVEGITLQYGQVDAGVVVGQQTVGTIPDTVFCRPRIAVRPDGGSVHTVWHTSSAAPHDTIVHAWREGDGSWQQEEVWGYSTDYAYWWETVAVDSSETVQLLAGWAPRADPCQGQSRIASARKPQGGTFSAVAWLAPDDCQNYDNVVMATDPSGGVHGRWAVTGGGDLSKYLRYVHAEPGGDLAASDVEELQGAATVNSMGMGDLYAAADGTVHFAINAYENGVNVDYAVRAADGSFSTPVRIAGPITNAKEITPSIGVDAWGNVYVLWGGEAMGAVVRLATYTGGGWTIADLDNAAGMNDDNIKPRVVVAGEEIYALWRTGTGNWVLREIGVVDCAEVCQGHACSYDHCHCGDCLAPEICSAEGQCVQPEPDAGTGGAGGAGGGAGHGAAAAAASPADESGGCGCRSVPLRPGTGAWILGVLAAATLGRARRVHRASSAPSRQAHHVHPPADPRSRAPGATQPQPPSVNSV